MYLHAFAPLLLSFAGSAAALVPLPVSTDDVAISAFRNKNGTEKFFLGEAAGEQLPVDSIEVDTSSTSHSKRQVYNNLCGAPCTPPFTSCTARIPTDQAIQAPQNACLAMEDRTISTALSSRTTCSFTGRMRTRSHSHYRR